MSDDERYGPIRARELEQTAVSLAAKNDRLAKALDHARQELASMQNQIDSLMGPPASHGVFVRSYTEARQADVFVQGRLMRVSAAMSVPLAGIRPGQRVLLNDHLVINAVAGYDSAGELALLREKMPDGRVRVAMRGDNEYVLRLAGPLNEERLRLGDALVADIGTGFAYERVSRSEVEELLLEEIPDVTYGDIGGLQTQIEEIRDTVELPFTHPQLYRDHGLKPPKGVLLYGPPGCGKTLIAKAIASSLAAKTGGDRNNSYFLNIKGPELLNKYVGETERQIRVIFSRAREKAASGVPVVIFFDEMEALFRTRGAGVSSDVETTVVPQLLAEIDGVEKLDNVIIVGASNREDMIDPAILRPGRLDVKIRVQRPDSAGAAEIFSKYITVDTPLLEAEVTRFGGRAGAVENIIDTAVAYLYERSERTRYIEVTYDDGETQTLHLGDFVSGAMIANIVDRAKKQAIKDLLHTGVKGVSAQHVRRSIEIEMRENEDLPNTTNPDEWARVWGYKGRGIARIRPCALGDKWVEDNPGRQAQTTPGHTAPGQSRDAVEDVPVNPEIL